MAFLFLLASIFFELRVLDGVPQACFLKKSLGFEFFEGERLGCAAWQFF
jgi:hypothetical protein